MNAIFTRTSVRRFKDQPIPGADITQILNAAFHAPSAVNLQPWEFIVVENRQRLNAMAELSPYAGALKTAAAAVVVLADTSSHLKMEYDLMDCAAATQNMLVEAKDLGIGSVWLGLYPEMQRVQAAAKLFDLPEHITPLWIAAFGYPQKELPAKSKWNDNKVHYETY